MYVIERIRRGRIDIPTTTREFLYIREFRIVDLTEIPQRDKNSNDSEISPAPRSKRSEEKIECIAALEPKKIKEEAFVTRTKKLRRKF